MSSRFCLVHSFEHGLIHTKLREFQEVSQRLTFCPLHFSMHDLDFFRIHNLKQLNSLASVNYWSQKYLSKSAPKVVSRFHFNFY